MDKEIKKISTKYYESIVPKTTLETVITDIKKTQLLLKAKADFISVIINELLKQEEKISDKHFVPWPQYINFS